MLSTAFLTHPEAYDQVNRQECVRVDLGTGVTQKLSTDFIRVVHQTSRNQLTGQTVRGFESLHLRQNVLIKKMHSKNTTRKCGVFASKRKNRRIQNRKVRFSKRGSAHSENGGLGDAHGPFYEIR